MKKLLLGLLMLFAWGIYAQSPHTVDFEAGGVGSGWSWTVFEFAPQLNEIPNPYSGGINTSATVMEFIADPTDQPWAGCWTMEDGEFMFDETNSTVSIMVHKDVISVVKIKFEGASPPVELDATNTTIGAWEILTYDFSGAIGNSYSKLVIFPDFNFARTSPTNSYFDNIVLPDGQLIPPPPEPLVAAPDPTQDPGNVISMFSDVYTDVAVDTWLTSWSDATLEEVFIDGNPTKKYTNVNFFGVETVGPNLIDASGMTHFHLDMWTPDANDFKVKLVDFGADGAYGGGDDSEHEITFPAPATEQWISYDIPLADFTGLASTEHLAQLIIVKAPLGIVYIDNVFYYVAPESPYPTHLVDFETSGVGNDWTWIVVENDDNPPVEVIANPVGGGINTSATVAKFIARQNGQPWALCYTDNNGEFTFDADNSTVTIMVYKSTESPVSIKFEGISPEVEIQVPNTLINQWEELTFDFSGSIGNTYSRLVIIPDFTFDPRPADNILYFDNIELPEGAYVPPPPEPLVAAPDPTQDPGNVISMFSDVYTDVAVDTWLTSWSDATLEEVFIDGNPTKKYTNVNFFGVETVGPNLIDASGMTHFHLDMWTPDANDFKVKLVDFGADGAYGGGDDSEHEITFPAPATEQWISYDIPLADFTGLASTEHLAQLIMVKAPLGIVYIDNVFYYVEITGSPLEGTLTYFNNNTPIDNVLIDAGGFDNGMTDEMGYYGPLTVPDGPVVLSVTNNKPWAAFNVIDVVQFRQFLATGSPALAPIQLMAADVFWQGGMNPNVVDAVVMRQKLANLNPPNYTAEDWLYLDVNVVVDGPTTHNFEAIMSGDVNGSNIPE